MQTETVQFYFTNWQKYWPEFAVKEYGYPYVYLDIDIYPDVNLSELQRISFPNVWFHFLLDNFPKEDFNAEIKSYIKARNTKTIAV